MKQEMTVKNMIAYLAPYDDPFEEKAEEKDVVETVLKQLKQMPDCQYRLRSSYYYPVEKDEPYDLFYISDMFRLWQLLRAGQYNGFIHELYDFLQFKILQNEHGTEILYLPNNIKNALIYVIEQGREEHWQ